MAFTEQQIKQLNAKLDAKHVKQRDHSGRKLSYVEGWHAIAEANRIFGHDGWERRTTHLECVWTGDVNGKAACTYVATVTVTVFTDGRTIVRQGTGAGHGIDRNMGLAHESAIKEAETDAMKRALMTFGWPFGLALYDKDQEHVETAPARRETSRKSAEAATTGETGTPAGGSPSARQPTSKLNLRTPTGEIVGSYERASQFLTELRRRLETAEDGRAWWAINGSLANWLAEKDPRALPLRDACIAVLNGKAGPEKQELAEAS